MVAAVEHVSRTISFIWAISAPMPSSWRSAWMQIPVLSVTGNCDFLDRSQEQRMVELEGVKILLCHGHRYHVKSTLLSLFLAARKMACAWRSSAIPTLRCWRKGRYHTAQPRQLRPHHASQLRCGRTFRRGIHLPH